MFIFCFSGGLCCAVIFLQAEKKQCMQSLSCLPVCRSHLLFHVYSFAYLLVWSWLLFAALQLLLSSSPSACFPEFSSFKLWEGKRNVRECECVRVFMCACVCVKVCVLCSIHTNLEVPFLCCLFWRWCTWGPALFHLLNNQQSTNRQVRKLAYTVRYVRALFIHVRHGDVVCFVSKFWRRKKRASKQSPLWRPHCFLLSHANSVTLKLTGYPIIVILQCADVERNLVFLNTSPWTEPQLRCNLQTHLFKYVCNTLHKTCQACGT